MIHSASRIAISGPALFPFLPPPPRVGIPPRIIRPIPSRISSTAPTSAANVVIKRTSRFLTCPSSWAITAWSSSRLQIFSNPRVTAMCESRGSWPVANALGSSSGMIQSRGRNPGGDGHLVDDVRDLAFGVGLRIDQLLRAGRPENLFRPGLVGVPRGDDRDRREQDTDPGERVMALQCPDVVAAESQPGEKQDEANHQPGRAPAIGFLLLKEITVGRGQPAVPRVLPDLRSPTDPPARRAPGPLRASWETAAAWCCIASQCRCRAGARTQSGSLWTSTLPAAGRCCRSP